MKKKAFVKVSNINRDRFYLKHPQSGVSTLKSNEEANLSESQKISVIFLPLIHVVISSQHRRKVPHWGSHTLVFLCLAGVLLARSSRAETDHKRDTGKKKYVEK